MSLFVTFWVALGATVALLGVDLYTGLTGKRAAHVASVLLTVVGLVTAIVLAVKLGSDVTFHPGIQLVHRTLARSVVVLLLPIAASGGLILLRDSARARPFHRRAAFVLVAVAVAALITGVWMYGTAAPRRALADAPAAASR
ncbi:MAG: hypothetical protein IPK07_15470 [Deltaproteobacteria bacterium]|nr:hypothetical protein [Deltaproteobacteria bacterium]